MKKQTILTGQPGFTLFYVGSIAMVTAQDSAGCTDICTIGDWAQCNVQPNMYGFALCNQDVNEKVFKRYTLTCIEETGEFVINIPDTNLQEAWMKCGTRSLRREPALDKFALSDLTRAEAAVVKVPLIAECPINIECRFVSKLTLQGHDWVVGEVVAIHRAFEDDGSEMAIAVLAMGDACPTKPRLD